MSTVGTGPPAREDTTPALPRQRSHQRMSRGDGTTDPPGSLSPLIPELREGDRHALESLWRHFFQPLVRLARRRLRPGRCRAADAEDVALEAFLEFCDRLARPDADRLFPD